VGYAIDPRVQGTISLSSGRPVPKSQLIFILEGALRTTNAVLMHDAAGYRIVPADDAVGNGHIDRARSPETRVAAHRRAMDRSPRQFGGGEHKRFTGSVTATAARSPNCSVICSLAGQGAGAGASDKSGTGGFGGGGGGRTLMPGVRILADVPNNSVVVYANAEAYRVIERALNQLDRPIAQVAVDVTIAEVDLNNDLQYGVQFFLGNTASSTV
jgi:type II secretory pathway component GspD/PulD (secretin)